MAQIYWSLKRDTPVAKRLTTTSNSRVSSVLLNVLLHTTAANDIATNNIAFTSPL